MPVPETAMYKNNGFVFGQYDVRFSRHVFYVQPVPEPAFMQKPAHQHFLFGILAADARHVEAAGCLGVTSAIRQSKIKPERAI